MADPLRSLVALYRDAFGGLPARTWLLCCAAFLNRCGSMVVPFLGLYLHERFGFTAADSGLVVGLYGVGSFAGSWIGGKLTDRYGPIRLQIGALGSAAGWMMLMTQLDRPWLVVPAVFVLGFLNDMFRPGSNTAAAISCPPELRRRAMSLNRLALNLGWAFGPTIGGYLVQFDFRWMFVLDGGTSGIAALWLWKGLRGWNPPPPPKPSPPPGAADHGRADSPLRDRHFAGLMLANLLAMLAFMQYFTTGTRVFADLGYTEGQVGWILAVNPIVITICEMPTTFALRGRPALPLVAVGSLGIGIGYLTLLLPFGWVAIVFGMLVVAAAELLQMPLLGAYVNDHAPDHARGRYNGAYGMTFALALVLAPVLGGWIYEAAGQRTLWTCCGVLGGVAAMLFWSLRQARPSAAATAPATADEPRRE